MSKPETKTPKEDILRLFTCQISTDKLKYKAGETLRVRGILLNSVTHKPDFEYKLFQYYRNNVGIRAKIIGPSGSPLMDAKVLEEPTHSAVAFDYLIPESTAGGTYNIEIELYDKVSEEDSLFAMFPKATREFSIETFRAPRFKMQLVFVKKAYGEGEMAQAILKVERSEGGFPENAKVSATATLDEVEIFTGEFKVDKETGVARISFELPKVIKKGIGNLTCRVEEGASETISKTIPVVLKVLDCKIFPASGDLVFGVKNGVFVEAVTVAGKPADFTGKLYDNEGNYLAEVITYHEGRGYFEFTPVEGRKYQIDVEKPHGVTVPILIPVAKKTGVSILIDKKKKEFGKKIEISLVSSKDTTVTIELFRKMALLDSSEIKLASKKIEKISLDPKTVDGVLRVFVREKDTPLAERLLFVYPEDELLFDVHFDKEQYAPADKVEMTVVPKLRSSQKNHPGFFGVCVSDDSVYKMTQKRERNNYLISQYFLENEVGELNDADAYIAPQLMETELDKKIDPVVAMQLLLGVQGWRRFVFFDYFGKEIDLRNEPKLNEAKDPKVFKILNLSEKKFGKKLTPRTLPDKAIDTTNSFSSMIHKWEKTGNSKLSVSNHRNWKIYRGSTIRSNEYKFSIKVNRFEKSSNSWAVIIGVVSNRHSLNTWIGQQNTGWGYVMLNGKKNHSSGGGKNYGPVYGQGDIITVKVNLNNKTIKFFKNGIDLGVAYSNVTCPDGDALYMAASFDCKSCELEFVDFDDDEELKKMVGDVKTVKIDNKENKTELPDLTKSFQDRREMEKKDEEPDVEEEPAVEEVSFSFEEDVKVADEEGEISSISSVKDKKPSRPKPKVFKSSLKGESVRKKVKKEEKLISAPAPQKKKAISSLLKKTNDLGKKSKPEKVLASTKSLPPVEKKPKPKPIEVVSKEVMPIEISMDEEEEYIDDGISIQDLEDSDDEEFSDEIFSISSVSRTSTSNKLYFSREFYHTIPNKENRGDERTDFTETLLWVPIQYTCHNLNKDERSKEKAIFGYKMEFDLNDNVSTFRVFVDGYTKEGVLGSSYNKCIECVKPFYVEPKIPLEVSFKDVMSIPVTVVNNFDKEIKTEISINTNFDILELKQKNFQLTLKNKERSVFYVDVKIKKPMCDKNIDFTIDAVCVNPRVTDKVTKKMTIQPYGFEKSVSFSGLVKKEVIEKYELEIPKEFIEGTFQTSSFVSPTASANLTSSLKGLIRVPCGCFEQVSSSLYPMIMAKQYFDQNGTDLKVDELSRLEKGLETGYNKLVSYQTKTGSFDWYGSEPGNESLTAMGIAEFVQLSKIWPVDQGVIHKALDWLLSKRVNEKRDGFLRHSGRYAYGHAPEDTTNSYILWALSSAKVEGIENTLKDMIKKYDGIRKSMIQSENQADCYVLSLLCLTFHNFGFFSKSKEIAQFLSKQIDESGCIKRAASSITRSGGTCLYIETTALAILSFMKFDKEFDSQIFRCVSYLMKNSRYGRFGSTQGTVLSIQAIVGHFQRIGKNESTEDAGTVSLSVGKNYKSVVNIMKNSNNPIYFQKFKEKVKEGLKLAIAVDTKMKEVVPYSLNFDYRVEKDLEATKLSQNLPFDFTVGFKSGKDITIEEGKAVEIEVSLKNKTKEELPMIVAIVELPGGLKIDVDRLKELKKMEVFDYYELWGARGIVFYYRGLHKKQTRSFKFVTLSDVPGKYVANYSRSYLYYNTDIIFYSDPLTATIQKK